MGLIARSPYMFIPPLPHHSTHTSGWGHGGFRTIRYYHSRDIQYIPHTLVDIVQQPQVGET